MPAVLESTHGNKRQIFKCFVFIKVNRTSYDYLYFYSPQKYSFSPFQTLYCYISSVNTSLENPPWLLFMMRLSGRFMNTGNNVNQSK